MPTNDALRHSETDMPLILPTTYWGPTEWFRRFEEKSGSETTPRIEIYDSFPKQTLRNRCTILSPTGDPIMLTVPVKKVESKQLTRDVEISYQQHWQHQHLNAIQSAYKKSPYFDYYQDFIRPLYEHEYKYLLDLNEATFRVVASLLRNEMPDTKPLPQTDIRQMDYTEDWQNAETDAYWGDGISILDTLFREGPLTMVILQTENNNQADRKPQG